VYVQEQQQQQQQQQQRQDAYRRGFGAKVALPSTDVLHKVLVGHAATLKLRAYHLGTSPRLFCAINTTSAMLCYYHNKCNALIMVQEWCWDYVMARTALIAISHRACVAVLLCLSAAAAASAVLHAPTNHCMCCL
jgi:hypothetical protein